MPTYYYILIAILLVLISVMTSITTTIFLWRRLDLDKVNEALIQNRAVLKRLKFAASKTKAHHRSR